MAFSLPSAPYAAALALCFFLYFIVYPVVVYFRDPKGEPAEKVSLNMRLTLPGLRRFPNMSPLAGISSIPFLVLAHTGARTSHLVELHKKYPIIRTGPNTLSYSDLRAIKDIYGHRTRCTKDGQYLVTAGSHFHLADVIDKPEHARKSGTPPPSDPDRA